MASGEGNGTPLQYSCLENPMDRGTWWAAVHGVAKSWTWQSGFTFTFHFHALEKEMATHFSVLAWRVPGTGESGGLPSMGSYRIEHDWSDLAAAAAHTHQVIESISVVLRWGIERSQRDELLERMTEMFIILTVVLVSQLCTYTKICQVTHLKCLNKAYFKKNSLFYLFHTGITQNTKLSVVIFLTV